MKIAGFKHCPECGHPHGQNPNGLSEIKCVKCESTHFFNRNSVTSLIIPNKSPYGIWVCKRGIEPGIGKWCLPSGFSQRGETWQETGARETLEEINVRILDPNNNIKAVDVQTATGNRNDLLFGCVNENAVEVRGFIQNEETTERAVINDPDEVEFAFPLHKEAIQKYFSGKFFFVTVNW